MCDKLPYTGTNTHIDSTYKVKYPKAEVFD